MPGARQAVLYPGGGDVTPRIYQNSQNYVIKANFATYKFYFSLNKLD